MKLRLASPIVFVSVIGLLVLMLLAPFTTAFAQDTGPSAQAAIGGSIQQGSWYEQWNQSGTIYCPNNSQRFITTTSEAFTLSAAPGEAALFISYSTSRVNLYLIRSASGNYVYSETSNWWVHLIEVTRY
ncbi:MAG: hypothetical protein ABI835_13215, partial [Chloroflexota bacterium]